MELLVMNKHSNVDAGVDRNLKQTHMVTFGCKSRVGALKGAIFDWDGTLAQIDDREFYCINQTLKAHHSKPIGQEFLVRNYYQRAYEIGTGPRMVLEAALSSENAARTDEAYETYRKLFRDTVDKAKLQTGALEL